MFKRFIEAFRVVREPKDASVMEALMALHLPVETISGLVSTARKRGVSSDALAISIIQRAVEEEAVNA